MKILVTGGAGFIGSHIVEHALAAGHEVAALDDLSSGKRENLPPGVPLFVVDIRDRAGTLRAFEQFRPDAVSHQAAQASVTVSMKDPALDASVNVVGGLHVLEATQIVKAKRLVFASTGGAIYGNIPTGAADESSPANPVSPYAIHKLTFERLLAVARDDSGPQCTILRYANVYGPRQDPHGEAGVVAIFFRRALLGQDLTINAMRTVGDEGCIRDYVSVADVARANLQALEGKVHVPVLNLATNTATSTRMLAAAICDLAKAPVRLLDGAVRLGDVERSVLDARRACEILGEPVSLRDGLVETAAWYQTQKQ